MNVILLEKMANLGDIGDTARARLLAFRQQLIDVAVNFQCFFCEKN